MVDRARAVTRRDSSRGSRSSTRQNARPGFHKRLPSAPSCLHRDRPDVRIRPRHPGQTRLATQDAVGRPSPCTHSGVVGGESPPARSACRWFARGARRPWPAVGCDLTRRKHAQRPTGVVAQQSRAYQPHARPPAGPSHCFAVCGSRPAPCPDRRRLTWRIAKHVLSSQCARGLCHFRPHTRE